MYINTNYEDGLFHSQVMETQKEDFWNLHITLARIIAPLVEEFKRRFENDDIVSGYPSDLTPEEYIVVLDKISKAFRDIELDEYNIHDNVQEGLDLFAKYFCDLWE